MTVVVAVVLMLLVTAYVVLPLLRDSGEEAGETGPRDGELWARERAVAVLAISEADFDRATGKLSEADYQVLRHDYEGRALHAMDRMEEGAAPAPEVTGLANFCASCGTPFASAAAFCGGCGQPRPKA